MDDGVTCSRCAREITLAGSPAVFWRGAAWHWSCYDEDVAEMERVRRLRAFFARGVRWLTGC